ncbi:hypothetical protein [Actinomadura gamaensis]|uniref:Lipoprotein n=1 Tax=Actinomadura gamaensis TaxID=1763541 RepID=A0ABV9U4A9_9ACTN
MLRPLAATALVLALATACGGGGGGGGKDESRNDGADGGQAAPSRPAPSAPVTMNGVQPGRAAPSKLDGTWTSGRVKLFFYRGAAAVNSPTLCTGTVDAQNTIALTCADKSTERTRGKAVLSGSALTVTWTSGTVDRLTRQG